MAVVEVVIYRRPNMFKVNENLLGMIGLRELEKFFTIPDYKGDGDIMVLYYPERFLNIVEQRALISRLEVSNYKKVRIITHSVYIVTCSSNVVIAEVGESLEENQFKLSCDNVGMPDDSQINIL